MQDDIETVTVTHEDAEHMETILWRFWRQSPHTADVWERASVAVPPGDNAKVSSLLIYVS